jgi:hypothetical protein
VFAPVSSRSGDANSGADLLNSTAGFWQWKLGQSLCTMFATTMLTNSDNQGWSALDRFMAFDRNKGWTTLLQESFQHLASLSFVPGDRTLMNRLQSLMVLPLAVAAFVATVARGQLTCDAPQQAVLGVTPFASLLSFPPFLPQSGCYGSSVDHAVYFRFTAPADGWYLFAVDMGALGGNIVLAQDCNVGLTERPERDTPMPPSESDPPCQPSGTALKARCIRMQAGESKLVVVGPGGYWGSGNGELRIVRMAGSLVENAQPLSVGFNDFQIPQRLLAFDIGCRFFDQVQDAVTFTFTPPTSGTYILDTCGTGLRAIGTSTDPDFLAGTVWTHGGPCGDGAKQPRHLEAGVTYFVCIGDTWWGESSTPQPCQLKQLRIECLEPCPADFNDDDVTDGVDLGIMLAAWGTPERDITGDDHTDGVDLGILLAMWGACSEG